MNIEEYMKIKHRNIIGVESEQDKKIHYLKFLLTRILLSIILVISICIYLKFDEKNILLVEKYLFEESLQFTKINNRYQSHMGEIIPAVTDNTSLVFSSSELKMHEYEKYNDGVKINLNNNTPISSLNGGIVVYIGEKDNYGNTLIIQGNDGIDYWYGGITNISVNLYDYIEKDTLIGETTNDYLYLVLQKNGEYINYEEII